MKNNNIVIIHRIHNKPHAEYQNEYSAGNYLLSYFISPNMSVSIQKDTDNSNVNFLYYLFHSASSRYPEEACNFSKNKFFMIYTHTFAEVLSSLFASAVCNFDNFLTLYESISFIMSAVLGTTADCIFSIKTLFLNFLKKLHDLNKMQDAMLHILSDALRLLKYARQFANINIFSLPLNYCYSGQYFKNGGRK